MSGEVKTEDDDAERASVWKGRMPTTPEEFVAWMRDSGMNPLKNASWSFGDLISRVPQPDGYLVFGLNNGDYRKDYVAFDKSTGEIAGSLEFKPSKHPGDETELEQIEVRGKPVDHVHMNGLYTINQPVATFIAALKGEPMVCWMDDDHTRPRSTGSYHTTSHTDTSEDEQSYKERIIHHYGPKSVVEAHFAMMAKNRFYREGRKPCLAVKEVA